MNPTQNLPRLLAASCLGWSALPLAAETPPVVHDLHPIAITLLPDSGPLGAIHAHVCGFHFYSGDMPRALPVHHYCSHLNPDVFQCVIYDSDQPNARLIGIEYIISEKLFIQLPADEKQLWHSHRYEVMSGLLTAPGLPAGPEKELMQELVNTYGKTWHLWQVDRGDAVPLGLPKLMMGFTADGQAGAAMIAERDREQKIDTARVKARRTELSARPVSAGADAWQHTPAFQISDELSPRPAPRP
jgi:hypothetical protein